MSSGHLYSKLKLIIVAIMIGVSNVIYEEDKMIDAGEVRTEQEQNKDESINNNNNIQNIG